MKFKRKLAYLLVIVLLFSLFPTSVLAYPETATEFKQCLINNGLAIESNGLKPANFTTYKRYGLVVYGNYWGEARTSRAGKEEYRYLGYTQTDQPYTNSLFPNDVNGSKTPLQWTYENVNGSSDTWINLDGDQESFMLSSNLKFESTPYSGLTVNWITKNKARLLSPASLKNGFSVYTQHKGADGKLYYATFYGPDMGGSTNVNCTITTPANTYTIKADQANVTVPVSVTATAQLVGAYVKPKHIKSLKASFEDSNNTVANLTTTTTTKNKVISRSEYAPGIYTIPLTGTADMESTLSGADKYTKQATKNITLIVEGNPTSAYVDVTATVNPSKKQVTGSVDELVTVTVNAALKNYTDTSNIGVWNIYAKLDGEDITLQQKTTSSGVLSSSASFNFIISKSKFNVDNFIQSFKTTAVVSLNRPINGVSSYTGTAYVTAEFYKVTPDPGPLPPSAPPVGANLPPVAVLGYEETVRAGDETMVDALSSYDTDGTIVTYNVYTPSANVVNTDVGLANVWYPYTGKLTEKYRVAARVVDNQGAANGTTQYITVTEPTIEAKIDVTGKLKVNRLVTITNASDSPERYPLDNTKTVWTLQAVSGGTNADIKFNGVLTGINTINAIFKKQGVYKATLSVTNTAGFKGTKDYLINIGPDLKPVANFETATTVLRNVEDYGNATIELLDTSYSLDGDILSSRIWSYAWDSNNNGSFADETYKIFDSGNNTKPILKVSNVGKYNIKLLVQENFTDTLPLYILPADYLSDDTVDKPLTESVVEVINVAPTIAFSMINKKKVDLIFNVWDTVHSVTDIITKINSTIVPAMSENNIDAQITINKNYSQLINTIPYNTSWYIGSSRSSNPNDEDYSYDGVYHDLYTFPAGYASYNYNSNRSETYYLDDYHINSTTVYGDMYYLNKTDSQNAFQSFYLYDRSGNKFQIAYTSAVEKPGTATISVGSQAYSKTPMVYTVDTESRLYIKSFRVEGGKLYLTATGIFDNWTSGFNGNSGSNVVEFQDKEFVITPTGINMDNLSHIGSITYLPRQYNGNNNGRADVAQLGTLTSVNDTSKYMDPLLAEYTPRVNSKPYLITIADNQLTELADPVRAAKVLAQTLEKNINSTALGTTNNITQLSNFNISNNNNGTFIDNTNLDTAITGLKDYILGRENQEEPKTQYAILGEELEYLSFYDDYEDDIKNAEYWWFTHLNPYYYDNSLGVDPQSGVLRTVPVTSFNKVGLYDVLLKVQDNPYNNSLFDSYKKWSPDTPMQLYVHRRPIAAFKPYIQYNSATNKYYITAAYNSYDLDHSVSRADKGIIQKQWTWKLEEDVAWQSGTPSNMIYGKTYLLQLMVKDIEGAWSLPAVETVKIPDILIYANPSSLLWRNTNAAVNLAAKINAGTFSRIDYQWTNSTIKPAAGYTSTASISNNLTQSVAGEWYLHATAYTLEGKSAYDYFGPYQIDKTAPTITPVKTGGVSGADVTVDATIADTGGSLIKDVKYRWTNTTTKPTAGWTVTTGSFSTTHAQDGVWYLHIEATDNAGNITYTMVSVPYIVINANPASLPWQNTNAVVNLSTATTNGTFSRIDYQWTNSVTKPTSGFLSSASTSFNTTQSSTGIWYLHAEAYETGGQSRYNSFGPYQIDKIAPSIEADKTNAECSEPVTVNIKIEDEGGSGIKDVKYRWSNSTIKPTLGWSIVKDSFTTTLVDEGTWYLHIEATDNAGNITYKYLGTYKVNTFKLENFRVVMVRDIQLEDYYFNNSTGIYNDKAMYVNKMALDNVSFGSVIDGLTKGYKFEFEIDSRNFNEDFDKIIIEPRFYTTDRFARDLEERDLYWEDSSHQISKVGEGGHSTWKTIMLDASDRSIKTNEEATWRGEYLIPGSSWAVPKGTLTAQAMSKNLERDIIVNFHIKGYKASVLKFDYNTEQWGVERTINKYPYLIGDVIRYSWDKNCLDDIIAKDNR
jgi:hypothetical protein